MLFFSFLDNNSNLQVTKVKMMEAFRISKITDLLGMQSVAELATQLFNIRGIGCNKALISDLFKKVCPDTNREDKEELSQDDIKFMYEFRNVINCFFS